MYDYGMTNNAPTSGLVPFTLVQISAPGKEPPIADSVTNDIAAVRHALEAALTPVGRTQILGELRDLATSWQMLAITHMTPISLEQPHKPSGKRESGLREVSFAGRAKLGTGIKNS